MSASEPDNHRSATSLAVDLARIGYRLETLEKTLSHLEASLSEITTKVDAIRVGTDRWKGGILVVIAIGGIISWFVSIWSSIGKAIK